MYKSPYTRRARRRHKPITTYAIFSLLAIYVTIVLLWPVQAVQASITPPEPPITSAAVALPWPAGAQHALGAVDYGELDASGNDASAPMASITKLVTALVVLEAKPLASANPGPTLTFTTDDVARYNDYLAQEGSVGPVTAGQTISQYDTLQILLISSANNYADTLAIWAYGSMEAYLDAANRYLTDQGLSNTVVADASGFSPNSKSSARDLIELGELALSNPVIAEIVDKPSVTLDGFGTFYSTNLLIRDEHIIGLKTGTTDEAGNCLVYAASYTIDGHPVKVIGVSLDAPDRLQLARDASALLEASQNGFEDTEIAHPDDAFVVYESEWGETVSARPTQTTNALLWTGNEGSYDINAEQLSLDTEPQLSATYVSGELSVPIELEFDEPLTGPSWFWRITHPHKLFF